MALQIKTIKLISPTSTGNQATTGVGFQPKAVMFFATYQTAEGTAANAQMAVGAAVSSSSRAAIAVQGLDNVSTTDSDRRSSNTKCITLIDNAETTLIEADFVSMDSDGFTLNFTTVQASNYNIYALCLGGSSLTNTALKEFAANTGTGSQAITGVGFQPDAMLMFSVGDPNLNSNTTAVNYFGIGLDSSNTVSVNARMNNIDADTHTGDVSYKTDKIITSTTGAVAASWEASLTSMDSDGFTLNWTTAASSARRFWALCLRGGNYKLATITQPSSTGNQATTGVGFKPSGLFALSAELTATGVSAVSNIAIGAGTSSSNRFSVWNGVTDGVSPNRINMNNNSNKIITLLSAGSTATVNADADLVSLDTDGFTLNWTTADGTARKVPVLALGPAAVPPVINSALTASGTAGSSFSYQITATNSPTSYNATGLPSGLSVNTGTGVISGTPTSAGVSNITISATNADGTGSDTLVLTINSSAVATDFSHVGGMVNMSRGYWKRVKRGDFDGWIWEED